MSRWPLSPMGFVTVVLGTGIAISCVTTPDTVGAEIGVGVGWAFAAIYSVMYVFAWNRRRRLSTPGKCQSCGYNLTGNVSGTCPECGTPVRQMAGPS